VTNVLDASAFLAYLHGEAGAEVVAAALAQGAAISIVNLTEVLSKLAEVGRDPEEALMRMRGAGLLDGLLTIFPLIEQDALRAAAWRPLTRELGLSLGDRCCLALAQRLGLPALTADRSWATADLRVAVTLIR
jgi:ribonuclease VapC